MTKLNYAIWDFHDSHNERIGTSHLLRDLATVEWKLFRQVGGFSR